METGTFISVITSLITQLGTLLVAVWWLSKRMDRLEEKFDQKLNNGIGSRIGRVEEKVNRIEGRLSARE